MTDPPPSPNSSVPFTPRRKRHARSPREGFELSKHDVALLEAVARFRLLSTVQAQVLDHRNADVVQRRLRDLYDHGYLDRPQAELARLFRMRNAPGIYAITNKGAHLLRQAGALPLADRRVDWGTKNARLSDIGFIEHTLKVTDVVLAFANYSSRHELTMTDQHQLLQCMPETTQQLPLPFRLRDAIDDEDRDRHGQPRLRSVTPDRLLAFEAPGGERITLALEVDNGTLPEVRSSFDQTSNLRKIAIYHAAHRDGLIRDQWGVRQFYVAFITTTAERERHMLAAQRAYLDDKGSRLFLFTTNAAFAAGDPFSPIWRNGRGEGHGLLPRPT